MRENISRRLKQVLQLTESWEKGDIPEIERDMVLGILQSIYEELKFSKTDEGQAEEKNMEKLFCQSIPKPVLPVKNVSENINEHEVTESVTPLGENKLFNLEDIPVKSNRNRKVILSLYGEDSGEETRCEVILDKPIAVDQEICEVSESGSVCEKTEEIEIPDDIFEDFDTSDTETYKQEVEVVNHSSSCDVAVHAEERKAVIGDVIKAHEKTIADSYAENNHSTDIASKISSAGVVGLRKAIGLNDKFLMIRDMFDGDADGFEAAIDDLEAFDDLNEALIHIHENYSWNPNSDGAKLLIDILTKKLS